MNASITNDEWYCKSSENSAPNIESSIQYQIVQYLFEIGLQFNLYMMYFDVYKIWFLYRALLIIVVIALTIYPATLWYFIVLERHFW